MTDLQLLTGLERIDIGEVAALNRADRLLWIWISGIRHGWQAALVILFPLRDRHRAVTPRDVTAPYGLLICRSPIA